MKSLNYITITTVINELIKAGETEISDKLLDILNNNELPKAEKHNRKNDLTTSFYKIDLDDDTNEEIIEVLSDFLVESFMEDGEPSTSTYHYENLIDDWSR